MTLLGFTDIPMSEPEENQLHQQSHSLPAPGYEASQEERHSLEIEEEEEEINTSVAEKRVEVDDNSSSLLTLAR